MDQKRANAHIVENKFILQILVKLQNLTVQHQQINKEIEDLKQILIQQATLNIPQSETITKIVKIESKNEQCKESAQSQISTTIESNKQQSERQQEINRHRQAFGRTILQNTRVSPMQYSNYRRSMQSQNSSQQKFPRRSQSVSRISETPGSQKRA